jgi:hypothetical protein
VQRPTWRVAALGALLITVAAQTSLGDAVRVDEGEEFVSPNVEQLDFAGALSALASRREKALLDAIDAIDAALRVSGSATASVGAWSDGTENSVMIVTHGASWDELRLAAAMEGALANQKAVLAVLGDANGAGALYRFQAKGDLAAIHEALLADGLEFHTLVPNGEGAMVYVADPDASPETMKAVKQAAARHNAEVVFHRVRIEFIGTQKSDGSDADQRADAQASYARIISGSAVQGTQVLWGRIHDQFAPAFDAGAR